MFFISATAELIKLLAKSLLDLTFGGAIPTLIIYGLPLLWLMNILGFTGPKKSKQSNDNNGDANGSWETSEKDKW